MRYMEDLKDLLCSELEDYADLVADNIRDIDGITDINVYRNIGLQCAEQQH